jgi:hypothetical protein
MENLISELQTFKAKIFPGCPSEIVRTQAALQGMGKIMMPPELSEFYLHFGGVVLGDAEIFGLEIMKIGKAKTRTLVEVNDDMKGVSAMDRKTIFGRNGLFFLCATEDFKFALIDIYTMRSVKTYDALEPALRDCLLVGVM